jgi:hypothetical protein
MSPGTAPKIDMKKYTARVDNIYFLPRIGISLRWATQDIIKTDLPPNVRDLLRRLERLEARALAKQLRAHNDPAA